MKKSWSLATFIAAAAGTALAGPNLDGSLAGDEGCYGARLWTQNVPTGFGDNHPDNAPPSGNAASATRGVELKIPLAALGLGGGVFRLAGWVTSGDHNFMSNQVIGGLPNRDNLGGPAIDFTSIPGNQYIQIDATTVATAPIIDGIKDSQYGGAQAGWLQGNYTGFGDNQTATAIGGGGSEIDYVCAVRNGGFLYLFIAGNLEANGNGLDLFFDSVAGGQVTLTNTNPNFANPSEPTQTDILNRQAGLTFDGTFGADYMIVVAGKDPGSGHQTAATYTDLGAGFFWYLGNGTYGSPDGTLTGGDPNALPFSLSIDNSNIQGVTGNAPVTLPSEAYAVGSEIDGLYGYIDQADNRLYLLVTGNLQSNNNEFNLVVDCQPGGQNTMLDAGGNVDIDFGRLARLGFGAEGPGLTYDADFFADYWINCRTGGGNPEVWGHAAVLRTNGKLMIGSAAVDYGAYDGDGSRAVGHPLLFNGTLIQGQDGFTPNLYTQYGPRTAAQNLLDEINDPLGDPLNPPAPPEGLVQLYINNMNIGGVTGADATNAGSVTTGIEISFDLDEVGWDGTSEVKVTGFVNNGDNNYMSNQVIGGLPDGTGNLAEVRAVNFESIAGSQYVVIPIRTCGGGCPADLSGSSDPNDPAYGVPDGQVDASDFFFYLDMFVANNIAIADLSGSSDPNDPAYGVPDGTIDASDFFFYLDLFVIPCP